MTLSRHRGDTKNGFTMTKCDRYRRTQQRPPVCMRALGGSKPASPAGCVFTLDTAKVRQKSHVLSSLDLWIKKQNKKSWYTGAGEGGKDGWMGGDRERARPQRVKKWKDQM